MPEVNTLIPMLRYIDDQVMIQHMTYGEICDILNVERFKQTGWEDAITPEIIPVLEIDNRRGLINGLNLVEKNPSDFQNVCAFMRNISDNGFIPSKEFLQKFSDEAATYARWAEESQELGDRLEELEEKLSPKKQYSSAEKKKESDLRPSLRERLQRQRENRSEAPASRQSAKKKERDL